MWAQRQVRNRRSHLTIQICSDLESPFGLLSRSLHPHGHKLVSVRQSAYFLQGSIWREFSLVTDREVADKRDAVLKLCQFSVKSYMPLNGESR